MEDGITEVLGPLLEIAVERLSAGLPRWSPGLDQRERDIVADAARQSWGILLRSRLTRLVLLEVNAARLLGKLDSSDPALAWSEFVSLTRTRAFQRELLTAYPLFRWRLGRIQASRMRAVREFARRFAADRALLGGGDLRHVAFDAGDSHAGGRSVARVDVGGRTVWYKPRSLDADVALAALVARVGNLRVPPVIAREHHGWAEHVPHRYCADAGEVARFYRALGEWMAVLLAVGASDMHMENVVADGPDPVVIDCETLFTPLADQPPIGIGDAVDDARANLVRMLSVALLPWRDENGHDLSATGGLPGVQPTRPLPGIADPRTDRARLAVPSSDALLPARRVLPRSAHLPEPEPRPADYLPVLLDGFRDMADRLAGLDARDELEPALRRFAPARMRYVPLASQDYLELVRAMWHPSAFRPGSRVLTEVTGLLDDHMRGHPVLRHDPRAVDDQVRQLADGDIPVHEYRPGDGRVHGPGGHLVAVEGDLVARTLDRWRTRDRNTEALVVRSMLAAAADRPVDLTGASRAGGWREHAEAIASEICRSAVPGSDGTAAWLGAVPGAPGYRLGVVLFDAYGGMAGTAVALAAYRCAVDVGAVGRFEGLDNALHGAVATLARANTAATWQGPGGYDGWPSLVWSWLALGALVDDGAGYLDHARVAGEKALASVDRADHDDVISGVAGSVVPLLELAEATGEERWLSGAVHAAEHLERRAVVDERGAWWPSRSHDGGVGGFGHGVTGIGWALARLAIATGGTRWQNLAERAFAFQEALWSPRGGGWRTSLAASEDDQPSSWCNGSTGIGLAHADLAARCDDPASVDVGRRAALHVADNLSHGHTLCHGRTGNWELVRAVDLADSVVADLGEAPPTLITPPGLFAPGLMNGLAGVLLHLLRAHSGISELPNPLVLDPRGPLREPR